MTATYTVTLNDAAKTDIEIAPAAADIENYGLAQAIIEAAQAHQTYKALRAAEDASIGSIWIDGEEITQF